MDIKEILRSCSLLKDIDDDGLGRMAEIASRQVFPAGAVIVKEGDDSDAFYVIAAGLADVKAEALVGEADIATLEPGSVFGEVAALTGQPRGATVTAVDELAVLRFSGEAVRTILKDYPEVWDQLEELGEERSEVTTDKVLDA